MSVAESESAWVEPGRLVEVLRELGYKTSWSADGGQLVEFEAAGYRCHVVPYPPSDLQLAVGFLKQNETFDLATINRLNLHHRFAKLVVDRDGDLLILLDIALSRVTMEAAASLLRDCLDTWEEVVTDVVASLNEEYPSGH